MQKRRTKKRYNLTDGVVRMRPYQTIALERVPDVADIQTQGRKSSTGKYASKSGDYKSYTRKAEARRKTRRVLKRQDKARLERAIREACLECVPVVEEGNPDFVIVSGERLVISTALPHFGKTNIRLYRLTQTAGR